jgi:hypothetical protein
MGILAPGYKQVGDFFEQMIVNLTADEDSGCKPSPLRLEYEYNQMLKRFLVLGASSYICNGERLTVSRFHPNRKRILD